MLRPPAGAPGRVMGADARLADKVPEPALTPDSQSNHNATLFFFPVTPLLEN